MDPSLEMSPGWFSSPTTTWRTRLLVRSIVLAATAVPVVAMIDPTATPIMVPFTPKKEAMTAASTAPTVDATICLGLSLITRRRCGTGSSTAARVPVYPAPGAGHLSGTARLARLTVP